MGTYKNCYELLSDVREGLNEWSDAYVQGSDTSGIYKNKYLLRKINEATELIFDVLLKRQDFRAIFYKEASLTGVSSVYTLPDDFGKLIEFRTADGSKINPLTPTERRFTGEEGSEWTYYRKGNTLVVDRNGLNTTCTLYYYAKPRHLIMGVATAGAEDAIVLDKQAKKIDDYYTGIILENVTQDVYATITGYDGDSRACGYAEGATAGDVYATVPEFPEQFHKYISQIAVILVKTELPVAQEKPSADAMVSVMGRLADTMSAYAGQADIPVEEYFMDD